MVRGASGSGGSGKLCFFPFFSTLLGTVFELVNCLDEAGALEGGNDDGPFMIRVTCSTVGVRRRISLDRDRMYL